MTQRAIEEYFGFEAAHLYNSLYVTSDDRVYVKKEIAIKHSLTLRDNNVTEWYKEYVPGNPRYVIRHRNL